MTHLTPMDGQEELAIRAGLVTLQARAHLNNREAGWYTDPKTGLPIERNVPELLALMHSEISEGLEGYRKNLMDDKLPHRPMIEVEFADLIIRAMDTAGYLKLDVAGAVIEKMAYNVTRADHQLANRAKADGKKF